MSITRLATVVVVILLREGSKSMWKWLAALLLISYGLLYGSLAWIYFEEKLWLN